MSTEAPHGHNGHQTNSESIQSTEQPIGQQQAASEAEEVETVIVEIAGAECTPSSGYVAGEGGGAILTTTPNDGYTTPKDSIVNKDIKLIQRAIRNGWAVPEEFLKSFPQLLGEIVAAEKEVKPGRPPPHGLDRYQAKPETRIKAIETVVKMSMVNQHISQDPGGEADVLSATREMERRRAVIVDDDIIKKIVDAGRSQEPANE